MAGSSRSRCPHNPPLPPPPLLPSPPPPPPPPPSSTRRSQSQGVVLALQAPTRQIPGFYHRRIGDIVVTALSDGYLDGTVDVLQNIAPDDATRC